MFNKYKKLIYGLLISGLLLTSVILPVLATTNIDVSKPAIKTYLYPKVQGNEQGLVLGLDMTVSGVNIYDKSVNYLNGTLVGTPTVNLFTSLGKTITFNGSSQNINIPDNDKLSFADANGVFTIVVIAKRNSSNNGGIFGKYYTGQLEYSNQIVSNASYFLTADNVSAGYRGRITAANAFPADGNFHFLVFRKLAGITNSVHQQWIDNIQADVADFGAGGYTQMRNTTAPLTIGFVGTAALQYFPGEVQSFKLYNYTLSTAEMTNQYQTFLTSKTNNKIVY